MWAEPPPPPAHVATERDVTNEIESIRRDLLDLRSTRDRAHIDEIRRLEIERAVEGMIADSQVRSFRSGRPWNEIASEDGEFTLDLDFYMQSSWSFNRASGEETQRGFQIDTVRITFQGTIIDPTWSYQTRLTYSAGTPGTIQFGIIQKDLGNGVFIQTGLLEPSFSLEQSIDNNQQLGVYLSFTAGQWDCQSIPGVAAGWSSDDVRGWASITDAWGGQQNSFYPNQRLVFITRGEWKPFGDWNDLYDFNPYPDSTVPGMLLGVGAAQGWGSAAIGTPDEYSGVDTRLTADLSLQGPGLGGMATISWQSNVPLDPLDGGGDRLAVVSQVGWFLDPKIEFYARGEWGRTSNVDVESNDLGVMTLGFSWMPRSNRMIKFSAEFMQTWGNASYWAIDGDPGIRQVDEPQSIVRAQLQLSF